MTTTDDSAYTFEAPIDHEELLARIRFSLDDAMRLSSSALKARTEAFDECRSMVIGGAVRVTPKLMPQHDSCSPPGGNPARLRRKECGLCLAGRAGVSGRAGDSSAGESNASASKRATGFHTGGPVGVGVGMGGSRVKLWASVEKYILLVASNAREWAFWEFHTRGSAPEVDTIIFRVVEEFQRVLQGVVM